MNSSIQQDDVVDKTWQKLHLTQAARKAVLSSTRMILVFIILFADMTYSVVSGPLSLSHPFVWFIELSIVILLLFQLTSNGMFLGGYFWSCLFGKALDVSEEQRRLMAIHPTDKGFRTPPRLPRSASVSSTPLTFSAGAGDSSNFLSRSPSPNTSYSPNYITAGGLGTPYSSFLSNSSGRNTSFNTSGFNTSLDRSMNLSQSFSKSDMDRHSLRSRRSASLPVSSRSSKYKHITDVDTLKRYIEEEDERELNKSQVSPENLSTSGTSFWNYGANPLDFSHSLRRFSYQLAPRTPASVTLRSSTDQGGSSLAMSEAWSKYNVTEDDLYAWTEKLRKWLSFTIISRLQEEIEEINTKLQKFNTEDRIGKVGVSTLSALVKQRMDIPTLTSIFPYLEFSANQEYLYSRIKELSTGSISAYTWDKGGLYGKAWSNHLPTDAAMVMHMFCCYLDARLPAHPRHPGGQPFTDHHFGKTPDKPSTDKDSLQIFQTSINPPHFQLVIGGETLSLSKGRNNMFQAILLFLYHIKVKESGMLGRINLGMSGLNILWIFD